MEKFKIDNHKKKKGGRKIYLVIGIILIFILKGFITKVPDGISYEGIKRSDSNIEFLYDLTYEKDGETIKEQGIFKEQLRLIENAERFIILDMFLFNDDYDRKSGVKYPDLSEQLTKKLIEKKAEIPDIKILFITDEINNFYGAYESVYLRRLKDNNIDVLVTNLEKLRDPNPLYAGIWRSAIKWFGTSGKGWLPNPFNPQSPKVTARGYLKLLNFKANHRKVMVSENSAIITSMNPHDASGNHSNIGFKMEGSILEDIVLSELNIAKLSNYRKVDDFKLSYINKAFQDDTNIAYLVTEGKIRDNLIREIQRTEKNNEIILAMFYLSHREVIKELINASNRGVNIKLILDSNKDAFGIKKNGIPNRQVAHEIQKKTNNANIVRWYDTHGEQFHSKMAIIKDRDKSIIIGGSANLTRRNLDNYNLETNIIIETPKDSKLDRGINSYFNRIWNNENGNYTIEYEAYESKSFLKMAIYRFQEWSGLSTF